MRILPLLFSCFALAPAARTDPDAPPVDAVVVGRVAESRLMVHRKARSTLFYVRLKVEVDSVEAGHERVRGAKFLDVRCWREDDHGQIPIPADGARFRASLKWNDEGHWIAEGRDAFTLLDGSAERLFPRVAPRKMGLAPFIGGLAGLAALIIVAFLRYRGKGPKDRSWSDGPGEGAA